MDFNSVPSPSDLVYFREIASTLNLSRASERLGVGQPALSLALKRLESQLKTPLFFRRSKGLELTSAGQKLLKSSNRLLADWTELMTETRRSQTELVGRFSLGCHPSVALYSLNPLIKDIYKAYPGIEIELTHGLSRHITEGVIAGRIDFGIVINPVRHPDLIVHKLAQDEVGFWKTKDAIEDVLILNPELMQTQDLVKRTKSAGFERQIVSHSLEVISSLAGSGAGVAILPSRVAKILAPHLKKMKDLPSFTDEIACVYRSDIPKTASSKAIIEKIRTLSI